MDNLVCIKNECEDFSVEIEVQPTLHLDKKKDKRQMEIEKCLAEVDESLQENQKLIQELNAGIDKLTNQADGIDYMVAVGSGILAGIIDIVFVGDLSLEEANEWGNNKTNDFVIKIAKTQGYNGEDLYGAVKFLEEKYPIAADKATKDFGGGLQHHLRDFSHHPTVVGLFFSILTQFTRKVYGTDVAGCFKIIELNRDGLLLVGNNFPEKVLFGIVNWVFHMVSDMAGSSSSILAGKEGTGIPGPIVSTLKELSALPIFNNMNEKGYKEFSVWISKLFNGTLLGKRNEKGELVPIKFDLRTEIGAVKQIGKQFIPVIINESIVRGFYFVRRLYLEMRNNNIKDLRDFERINWEKVLPCKNRTIIRMLAISTGTMTAIDLADAAIESAIKSGGVAASFVSNMILKVNFVGIGRFAIAVNSDIKMGIQRNKLRNDRIIALNKQVFLLNTKTFYKQAEMWIAAENAGKTIEEAYEMMEETSKKVIEAFSEMRVNMDKISGYLPKIEKKNMGLTNDMLDILKWG